MGPKAYPSMLPPYDPWSGSIRSEGIIVARVEKKKVRVRRATTWKLACLRLDIPDSMYGTFHVFVFTRFFSRSSRIYPSLSLSVPSILRQLSIVTCQFFPLLRDGESFQKRERTSRMKISRRQRVSRYAKISIEEGRAHTRFLSGKVLPWKPQK